MHELSIATSILKTATQEVEKIKGKKVEEIYLEIGKISGIEIPSLEFAWEQCMKDSVLRHRCKVIFQMIIHKLAN